MKLLVRAGAIFDNINILLFWLAAVLVAFAEFAVCYDVFMRYFLNKPTIWAGEITENIIVWLTFLGAAWVLKNEGHTKIDVLANRLGPKAQAVLNSSIYILCGIACLVVAWYSGQVVWHQFQEGIHTHTRLSLLMWPIYIVIPISLFLLFIQFLGNSYKYLAVWRLPQATMRDDAAEVET